MKKDVRLDANGKPFKYPTYLLAREEFARVTSEINSNYSAYANKKYATHYSVDMSGKFCFYLFENHGFDDFNIYEKFYI